jgi:hypothetical protein
MKRTRAGGIAVAVVLLAAAVGWGIAQAGEAGTASRVTGFEDQDFLNAINAQEPDLDHSPVYAEGTSDFDTTMSGPVETGSMPSESRVQGRETGFEDAAFIQWISPASEEDLDHQPMNAEGMQ